MTLNVCTASRLAMLPSATCTISCWPMSVCAKATLTPAISSRPAEIQFESGYPYIMFEDTVNRANPIAGRINMSNLCSEILQVNSASTFDENLDYADTGHDISCNLGSLNIAHTMDSPDFGRTVETAIRGLTAVSDMSHIRSVPSVGNRERRLARHWAWADEPARLSGAGRYCLR